MGDIPAAAALVRDFVNTVDVESGTDDLGTVAALRSWLADRALLSPNARVTAADLRAAHRLRASLRAALGATDPSTADADDRVLAELPLVVRVEDGAALLMPAQPGTRGALGRVAAAAAEAGLRGYWERLRPCREDTCQWVFYDTTKNRSRNWCAMGVCGNRAKTRAYRARQRQPS